MFGKALPLRRGGDAYDWLGLAIAHARLGNEPEAREWYNRGVGWLQAHGEALGKDVATLEELERFRRQAAELLNPAAGKDDDR